MRVLIVGAGGAIGSRLTPKLVGAGHEVIGTHTAPAGAARVRELGATPVMLDLLDTDAVRRAVLAIEPEAIVNEATALADVKFTRNVDRAFTLTNRVRVEGNDALLAAAKEAGVEHFIAQSFAPYIYAREGGPVKTEDAPLDSNPPKHFEESSAAMQHLDRAVTEAGGIVLRYGAFYGADNDGLVEPIKKGQFPIVGAGSAVTSFIHLEDAAEATVLALEKNGPAVYNVVDDDPAPVKVWLPVMADALGAKPPRKFPRWLGRLIGGEAAVMMGVEARGSSNAKAKQELGWKLRYPSWRQGFPAAYGAA
jgi:nucleoside-diphosphate-sugar epimerase